MGQVITIPEDRHRAVQLLLPWYVAGTLDEADRATVDQHLVQCAECRDDVDAERGLRDAVVADLPATEASWAALAARIADAAPEAAPKAPPPAAALPPLAVAAPRRRRREWTGARRLLSDPRQLRWVVGAQFAVVLVLGTMTAMPAARPGAYRALGDAETARAGNTLVMFRPETTEAALRQALSGADARLVDGPTSAGAYVLDVPGGENGPGLASLRRSPDVTMAEPIAEAPAE